MINQKNKQLGTVRSVIRELFEYGKQRKAEIGEENVFDFSLGNPSVPPPEEVKTELIRLTTEENPVLLHGYTSAPGDFSVRKAIADSINSRFNTNLNSDCIYVTCGASASLTIVLNALLNDGDEVITFTPFFPEYRVFIEHAGGKLIGVECEDITFQIDFGKLKSAITPQTKAVIINSPNNPSGVVYGSEVIKRLCDELTEYGKKFGTTIYLISDEPYRELVFDKDLAVPYVMNYYKNSIVCYSWSKSLSLPGERIGYIAVNNEQPEWKDIYAACCGAGRSLGFVCAPNMFQQLIKKCGTLTSDISIYKNNRDVLCAALTEYGYSVVKPDGAFYLFVKTLEPDAVAFAERAKKYELLLVPGNDFGTRGYVRIAYCVDPQTIVRALPAFKMLAESYNK